MPSTEDALLRAKEHLEFAYNYEEASDLKTALYECDSAVELIDAAFNFDEDDKSEARSVLAEAHNLRGEIFVQIGKLKDAISAYETALSLDPDSEDASDSLAAIREDQAGGSRLVTIASFSQVLEAHIVRGRLEASGIPAYIANENTVNAVWLYSNAVGGVQLQVSQEDVEAAQELISSEAVSDADTDDEQDYSDEEPDPSCPRCGSSRVHFEKYNRRAVFALWAILGFPLPLINEHWKCNACGHQWKEEETAP